MKIIIIIYVWSETDLIGHKFVCLKRPEGKFLINWSQWIFPIYTKTEMEEKCYRE